jgi:hypothetical protein
VIAALLAATYSRLAYRQICYRVSRYTKRCHIVMLQLQCHRMDE